MLTSLRNRGLRNCLLGFCMLAMPLSFGATAQAAVEPPLFGLTTYFDVADPVSVVSADVNGDDKADMAVASYDADAVSILLGDGNGGFTYNADYATGDSPGWVISGDFNGDNKPDLATANTFGSSVSVLLGDGSGGFAAKTDFAAGFGPYALISDDFNGDNKLDLAVANSSASTVSVLLGDGSGGFAAKADYDTSLLPNSVVSADFNGDNILDLALSAQGADSVSVLLGDGSGGFAASTDFETGANPMQVVSEDFNGDNKPDLAVACAGPNAVSILLGDGNGGFAAKTDFPTGANPISMTSEDFNGDAKPDLAAGAGADSAISVLLGDGSGGFGTRTDYAPGTNPTALTSGDLNNDHRPDLAVANFSFDAVSVVLNEGQPGPVADRTTLGFSDQTVDTSSTAQTVTISNQGNARLFAALVTVAGTNPGDFVLSADDCSDKSVLSSGSCTIDVKFAPSAAGPRNAMLQIPHDGASSPLSVPLSGTGKDLPAGPTGVAVINKVTVSGPKKLRKGKEATYKVKISNSGKATAGGVMVKVSGKGIKAKESVGNIAAGKTKAVKIKIKPKKPGKIKASFKVSSKNAGGKTVKKRITVRK